MPRGRPITIGEKDFSSKKECLEFFRDIKNNTQRGDRCTESELVKELLRFTVDYDQETDTYKGADLDRAFISTQENTYNSTCFCIDNMSFSLPRAITAAYDGHNKAKRQKVLRIMRAKIKEQIDEYAGFGMIICEITGRVYHRSDIHIDHDFTKVTFHQLAMRFLASKELTFETISIDWLKQTNEWEVFHKQNAVLRAIHKDLNLRG